jgi:hypothetical protein
VEPASAVLLLHRRPDSRKVRPFVFAGVHLYEIRRRTCRDFREALKLLNLLVLTPMANSQQGSEAVIRQQIGNPRKPVLQTMRSINTHRV